MAFMYPMPGISYDELCHYELHKESIIPVMSVVYIIWLSIVVSEVSAEERISKTDSRSRQRQLITVRFLDVVDLTSVITILDMNCTSVLIDFFSEL